MYLHKAKEIIVKVFGLPSSSLSVETNKRMLHTFKCTFFLFQMKYVTIYA